MNREYKHYRNYPSRKWRWPNFTPYELRSKGDNKLMVDPPSMDKLQALRVLIDRPIPLSSAYRSEAHNKSEGGAKNSLHMRALAYDCPMKGHDPAQFEAAARQVGFTGFGFYPNSNFIHVDTGDAREWGERWFSKADSYTGYRTAPKQPTAPANGGLTAVAGAVGVAVAGGMTVSTEIWKIIPVILVIGVVLVWKSKRK